MKKNFQLFAGQEKETPFLKFDFIFLLRVSETIEIPISSHL